eukprot:2550476-Amphidinium_carterae.1
MVKKLDTYPWNPHWGVPVVGRGRDPANTAKLEEPVEVGEEEFEEGIGGETRLIPWVLQPGSRAGVAR